MKSAYTSSAKAYSFGIGVPEMTNRPIKVSLQMHIKHLIRTMARKEHQILESTILIRSHVSISTVR
jgi:hypothetical protein